MLATFDIPHTWEEPEDLFEFLQTIRELRPEANVRRIRYAYFIAEQAHSGQKRGSGEPYITHPLAVAQILVELNMDEDTICAALLHDTIEDTSVTHESLTEAFGETVSMMVEGVTKLKFKSSDGSSERAKKIAETHRAAESLRKMLLAMAKDVRVMVIKLADRLHNMRTLDGLPEHKRVRIATETLDVFAPLSARLGIWQVKWQLEDLAFKVLHPKEYGEVQSLVARTRTDREEELREATLMLKERLQQRGVKLVEIQGRPKHLYSIFNKIVKHGFKFEEILDLIALRVIVAENADCYVALGVVNEIWIPMNQYFADYIARPKPNGYQSLHTKVIGPRGEPLEIQIRTKQMHQIAEMGVAAHYAYKEGAKKADESFKGLRDQLFDWTTDTTSSSDFLRSLSSELFSEQVFVFTPKGDVMDLPRDSTPIDFAFRVHSNMGLKVVGAKVNGMIVPLSTKLKNGDVVEMVTRSNAQPSYDWLEFVQSTSAKSKLRAYFRTRLRSDNVSRGRELLERELKSLGEDPKDFLGEDKLKAVAPNIKYCDDAEDVLAKVGEGLVGVQNVVSRLRGTNQVKTAKEIGAIKDSPSQAMAIQGDLESISMRRGKCCDPIPGEEVIGYVTRGRGVVIHRRACANAIRYQETDPERLLPITWEPDGQAYPVTLSLLTLERQGLAAEVTHIVAEQKANISGINVHPNKGRTFEWVLRVDVRNLDHLNQLMKKIGGMQDVFSILRVHGRTGSK